MVLTMICKTICDGHAGTEDELVKEASGNSVTSSLSEEKKYMKCFLLLKVAINSEKTE